MKRRVILFLILVGILITLYFLYKRQLGAISFYLLAIFFFTLAANQLSDPTRKKRKKKQSDR
ncbi:hypothetical protein EKG37_08145 [Robertmurraya yapensis]|uniref:Uncharacterized protein n=1 Tax=Bacillus yapensis TaxID=2492960 RepID=A0A3S0LDV5_9BACI|nr:hypothetical protein EKG37_08145 [Bacillus yapensis]TKS96846.1 hypothetical protein FAR12_08145 [Bacillus yapensis]